MRRLRGLSLSSEPLGKARSLVSSKLQFAGRRIEFELFNRRDGWDRGPHAWKAEHVGERQLAYPQPPLSSQFSHPAQPLQCTRIGIAVEGGLIIEPIPSSHPRPV